MWSSLPRSSPACCAGVDASSSCWDKSPPVALCSLCLDIPFSKENASRTTTLRVGSSVSLPSPCLSIPSPSAYYIFGMVVFSRLHPCEIEVARPPSQMRNQELGEVS